VHFLQYVVVSIADIADIQLLLAWFVCSYSMLLLAVTYVVPLTVLAVTYTCVGLELWGSKTIGERTAGQDETLKSKRKVPKLISPPL